MLAQSFLKKGWIERSGRPAPQITDALKGEFARWCDAETARFLKRCADHAVNAGQPYETWMRDHGVDLHRFANALRVDAYLRGEWALLATYYERGGRQIFDLSDALVEELVNTDVDGATLEQLDLPFETFFIRFGARKDLKRTRIQMLSAPVDEFIDGAFIVRMPGSLRVGLSLVHADGTPASLCRPIDIPDDAFSMPCMEAIDLGCRRHAALHPTREEIAGDAVHIVAEQMNASLTETRDLLSRALPLVLNSLFYIESLEKKFDRVPGRDASAERRTHWARATEDGRRKLTSKLEQEGYAVVYMVGTEITSAQQSAAERGLIAPHWRRGHWRMQRHGPQRSLVKRIRIKPILVNADAANDQEVKGHVYRVDP